jgi:DNA-3-methyladenine glycosylase I
MRRPRCAWCDTSDPLYVAYHDQEWGRAQRDPHALFEKLCLEGFQAGLSWRTVLHKRGLLRAALAGFDPDALAAFSPHDIAAALSAPGVIRHRGKVEACTHNARVMLRIPDFAAFLWAFAPARATDPAAPHIPESAALAAALKARGWRFIGPTSAYAFMQSVGMAGAHAPGCFLAAGR